MLLALQTTSSSLDDGSLDAVTIVLLAAFVVSLTALAVILSRRGHDASGDEHPLPERPIEAEPVAKPIVRSEPRPSSPPAPWTPAWLSGVSLPATKGSGLSDATAVIERLLEARSAGDLANAISLFSPAYRDRLASAWGTSLEGLADALRDAQVSEDGPALRSVELLSSGSMSLRVRATYADKFAETYQLVRVDGDWAIDSIERA